MDYFKVYREMLSLRGLTDHTVKSYSTYIRSYLDYLQTVLCKQPEDVSWEELREYIRWLQKKRSLSDRTINACISQLRFFTMFVLHKPWDPTRLPMRKFDSYLPFVPSREEMQIFLSSITDPKFKALLCLMFSAGLRIGEVRHLKCSDIEHSRNRILVPFLQKPFPPLRAALGTGMAAGSCNTGILFRLMSAPATGFSLKKETLPSPSTISVSLTLSWPMKSILAGNTALPAIPSAMRLLPIIMKTVRIF